MLFSVSLSSSPKNGDKPLSLDHEQTWVRDAAVQCRILHVCKIILNLQHVRDDAEAPHVCGEWNKLVVDDLRG